MLYNAYMEKVCGSNWIILILMMALNLRQYGEAHKMF